MIPRASWLTAGALAITVVYAVLQVGFVRPYLPADPRPNMARAPADTGASPEALAAWRAGYHAGPGSTPVWRTDAAGWARANLGMIVQVVVFTGAAIVLFILRSRDLTASLSVLSLARDRAIMRALAMAPEGRPVSPQAFAAELSGL